MSKDFFDTQSESSRLKTTIVVKYFVAWATLMSKQRSGRDKRIGYVDLYAGPGRYEDGAASTPIALLEHAIAQADLHDRLVCTFNDSDPKHVAALQAAIDALPGITMLKHRPIVRGVEVDMKLATELGMQPLIPTFAFVDPWGYKGMSLRLLYGLLKDWGSDCVFFFNVKRIYNAIDNPVVDSRMEELFGTARLADLRAKFGSAATTGAREQLVLEAMRGAVRENIGSFVLPFRFYDSTGKRISHCLVFVSKKRRGYAIMKDIMALHSKSDIGDVPSYAFNAGTQTSFISELEYSIEKLADELIDKFAGMTLTMNEVFEQHNVDTPYISRNYKAALALLEERGAIRADPPAEERRGFADHVRISFPPIHR